MSLSDGFNTSVGSRGSMLSGGQKQRIAIARALVRDPRSSSATSALDSKSEMWCKWRWTRQRRGIAVAHRLSTIQKADIIYVFDQGRIVEHGNHTELMIRSELLILACEMKGNQNLCGTQLESQTRCISSCIGRRLIHGLGHGLQCIWGVLNWANYS